MMHFQAAADVTARNGANPIAFDQRGPDLSGNGTPGTLHVHNPVAVDQDDLEYRVFEKTPTRRHGHRADTDDLGDLSIQQMAAYQRSVIHPHMRNDVRTGAIAAAATSTIGTSGIIATAAGPGFAAGPTTIGAGCRGPGDLDQRICVIRL
jgi:hypothetical protein